MNRRFSPCSLMSALDNHLLTRLFALFGADVEMLELDHMKKSEYDDFYRLLELMPQDQSDRLRVVLESIGNLANKRGMAILGDVGRTHFAEGWRTMFTSDETVATKALRAWLDYREIFHQASALMKIEQETWSIYRDDLSLPRDFFPDSEAVEQVRREVRFYLRSLDGRGKACSVRTIRKGDWFYTLVFPDDYAENLRQHDDQGALIETVIRKTFTIIFGCNPATGKICLKTEGGAKFQKDVLGIIFQAFFGTLPPPEPHHEYDLNVLLEPGFRFTVDSEDCVEVRAKSVTVVWIDNVRHVVDIPPGVTPRQASLERYDPILLNGSIPSVIAAKLTFVFYDPWWNRLKTVQIPLKSNELRVPFGLADDWTALIRKYLKRWNLSHDHNDYRSVRSFRSSPDAASSLGSVAVS